MGNGKSKKDQALHAFLAEHHRGIAADHDEKAMAQAPIEEAAHEAAETPEEEAQEKRTGREIHPPKNKKKKTVGEYMRRGNV